MMRGVVPAGGRGDPAADREAAQRLSGYLEDAGY